jgi:hypothetical protein
MKKGRLILPSRWLTNHDFPVKADAKVALSAAKRKQQTGRPTGTAIHFFIFNSLMSVMCMHVILSNHYP